MFNDDIFGESPAGAHKMVCNPLNSLTLSLKSFLTLLLSAFVFPYNIFVALKL